MIEGNHKDWADLGDAQKQGHRRQKPRLRHARRNQGNACRERLGKRRDDDAKRHAAYRLPRQDNDVLAALVGEPPSETPAPGGCRFAVDIKNAAMPIVSKRCSSTWAKLPAAWRNHSVTDMT